MNDFWNTIRKYLNEYLPNQRCLSENTVKSYRQVLNLFIDFMRDHIGMKAKQITFETANKEMVLKFLDWLEKERNCGISTRNQRLMVLRSFF